MEHITAAVPTPPDLTKERDERCIPIAKDVLTIIAACADGKLGSQAPAHEMRMSWESATRQMLEVCLAKDLSLSDVSYVNQLVLQAVETTNSLAVDSINASLDRLQQKLLDGKKLSELTLGEMDGILKGTNQYGEAQVDRKSDQEAGSTPSSIRSAARPEDSGEAAPGSGEKGR